MRKHIIQIVSEYELDYDNEQLQNITIQNIIREGGKAGIEKLDGDTCHYSRRRRTHFDAFVVESIQYPGNKSLTTRIIGIFPNVAAAIGFSDREAKDRRNYDEKTPYEYTVFQGGELIKRTYNQKILLEEIWNI